MEKTLKLYEGYQKMVERHYTETMNQLDFMYDKESSTDEGILLDKDIREFTSDVMRLAARLNTEMRSVNSDIEQLKREIMKKA